MPQIKVLRPVFDHLHEASFSYPYDTFHPKRHSADPDTIDYFPLVLSVVAFLLFVELATLLLCDYTFRRLSDRPAPTGQQENRGDGESVDPVDRNRKLTTTITTETKTPQPEKKLLVGKSLPSFNQHAKSVFNRSTLWGNTFILMGSKVGYASFHFDPTDESAYINYSSGYWMLLDNGSDLPDHVPFESWSFDNRTRTFRGKVDWKKTYKTSWCGDACWRYNLVFDSEYICILMGSIEYINIGGTKETKHYGKDLIRTNAALYDIVDEEINILLHNDDKLHRNNAKRLMERLEGGMKNRLEEEGAKPATIEEVWTITQSQAWRNYEDDATRLANMGRWGKKDWELFYVSVDLRGKLEVVMTGVRQNGQALQYASSVLRGNLEVVMTAVKNDGQALEYASAEMKANGDVVIEAVEEDGQALEFISSELYRNKKAVKYLTDHIDRHINDIRIIDSLDILAQDEKYSEILHEMVKNLPKIAELKDCDDKAIVDTAHPMCKMAMESALNLFRRYDIVKVHPISLLETSCVLKGETNDDDYRKVINAIKYMESVQKVLADVNVEKGLESNIVIDVNRVFVNASLCNDGNYRQLEHATNESRMTLENIDELISEVYLDNTKLQEVNVHGYTFVITLNIIRYNT